MVRSPVERDVGEAQKIKLQCSHYLKAGEMQMHASLFGEKDAKTVVLTVSHRLNSWTKILLREGVSPTRSRRHFGVC